MAAQEDFSCKILVVVTLDPDLARELEPARLARVRMLVSMAGGDPFWEIEDDGTVCLTWQGGDRDVVVVVRPSGTVVLYKGRERIPSPTSSDVYEAVRWMRQRVKTRKIA